MTESETNDDEGSQRLFSSGICMDFDYLSCGTATTILCRGRGLVAP